MIHLVTFSDESMSRSAELCVDSALKHGVDRNVPVGPSQRPFTFDWLRETGIVEQMPPGWWNARGRGYFLWKPYVTERAVRQCVDGDVLIYADAGIEFINNVNYIVDRMDQDIFLFGNNWPHYAWCKRDVIEAIMPRREFDSSITEAGDSWLRKPWERFGKQVQASVIFFRVSDYTRKFVKEWLDWCLFEGGRLIDDSPSRTPNHPEFREHRHDQAISTTLAYREGIKLHWWPAVYNKGGSPEFIYERGDYPDEGYPVLFSHHRKRNEDWEQAA